MFAGSTVNFFDPTNPQITLKARNLNNNQSANNIQAIKFILTTQPGESGNQNSVNVYGGQGGQGGQGPNQTIHQAPNLAFDLSSYVNLNPQSLITVLADYSLVNTNPTTSRFSSVSGNTVSLAYDSTVYLDNGNQTGFIVNFESFLYNNADITINLGNLYTFTNLQKYGVEATAISQSGISYSWDVQQGNNMDSNSISGMAGVPVSRYLAAMNVNDISLPIDGSTATDFGFNNIINNGTGTLLIASQFAQNALQNNTLYNFSLLNETTGLDIPLPIGSRVILYDYTPIYNTSVIFNDSNFLGGSNAQQLAFNDFSFSGVDTSQPIRLGFVIPADQGIASDINNSLTYTATVKEAANSNVVSQSLPTVLNCLYEDTEVLTPFGYVSVKQLKQGDEVTTSDGRVSRIVKLMISKLPASYKTSPFIIKAHSIAENYPPKDCRISKYHMIQFNGEWIAPYKNEHIFKADESIRSIKYYHIQLENFKTDHLVINGGLVVESLGNGQEDNCAEWDSRCNNSIIL